MQDWWETATLKAKIGVVTAREPIIFWAAVQSSYLSLTHSVDCIKIYNLKAMQDIGGVYADDTGRVDDTTNKILIRAGYTNLKDVSVVGVHACSNINEHDKYQKLWNNQAKFPWVKPNRVNIVKYKKTLQQQVDLIKNLPNDNTLFGQFLTGKSVVPKNWQGKDVGRKDGHLCL